MITSPISSQDALLAIEKDLKEIEDLKEIFIDHYIYDIWNPGAEEQTLERIRNNETF
ncbi:14293_t:CDS:2 [Entrophospora sp. SA101]|nr:14293_t:CDS:2 [Entrophospora sp. SA101]